MKQTFEYAVLGAGVVGSSAAWHLARAGRSVALIEQFDIGHERGSSHGESRITRLSYDHPTYIKLARRTFALWDELEKDSGQQLYLRTGGVDIGVAGDSRLESCRSSMVAENVPFEVLDAKEMGVRFPQFRLRPESQGLFQESTGALSATLCVKTLVDEIGKYDCAKVYTNTKCGDIIHADNNKVRLFCGDLDIEASNLILAAGAWAGPLLRKIGVKVPLQVTQEQWAFFQPLDIEAYMPGRFPVFIEYEGVGSGGIGWYGLPVFGKPGVKTAVHRSGPETTADTRTFEADEQLLELLSLMMKQLLPTAAGDIISTGTCLYTNSADQHFIIDRIPNHPNIVYFTGCSGHAFKFGPVLGETLICMLQGKKPPVPVEMFSASRFTPY
jgi:sarcosine oxidase